jgi:hypothetical protein
MNSEKLGFGARLVLAFVLPWRLLFNSTLAARVAAATDDRALPAPEPIAAPEQSTPPEPSHDLPVIEPEPVEPAGPDYTTAMQILALLQREGRLIDFLEEDVSSFSDADVGAAARVVHEGCKRTLERYLTLAPVRTEEEGAAITLAPGFDAARSRVTGNVVGQPPYRGHLAHPGWQVTELRLPTVAAGHDTSIIAAAEVEL